MMLPHSQVYSETQQFNGEVSKIAIEKVLIFVIDDFTKGLGIGSEWRKKEEGRIQWRFATKKQYCKHMFKDDLALLTIAISSPKIQRLVRRRRVTTSDLIGTLGKSSAFGKNLNPSDSDSTSFQGAHSGRLEDSVSSRSWSFCTGQLSLLEARSKRSLSLTRLTVKASI